MGSPLVTQLMNMWNEGETMARQKEEYRRRRAAEDFSTNLNIANLVRANAAQTHLADAPQENIEATAAAHGVEPMSHDVAQFAASPQEGPARSISIRGPDGKLIPLAPLKYDEELKAERLEDLKQQEMVSGNAVEVTPEMQADLERRMGIKGIFPAKSMIPKALLVQIAKPETQFVTRTATDGSQEVWQVSKDGSAPPVRVVPPPPGPGQPTGPDFTVHGEDFIKTLPIEEQDLVRAVSQYKAPIEKVTTFRGAGRQAMAQKAVAANPTFDMTQYPARQALRTSFMSGKGAETIRSLNQAIAHLGRMSETSQALGNTGVKPINWAKNKVLSDLLGDPRVNNFYADATAVADELSTVFKNTSGTDEQIKNWLSRLSSSNSPEALQGFVGEAINLINSRQHLLEQQWQNGMGGMNLDIPVIYPQSEAVLTKLHSLGSGQSGAKKTSGNRAPQNQEEYNALPSGYSWTDEAGKVWTKP